MEESKELQGFYKIFRTVVYVSVLLEFFEYAIDPAMLDHWGGILTDIHGRIKTMDDLPRRQSCVQQNRNGTAYLHHLCRNAEQEASGVQRTPAGGVSIDEWVIAARTLRMAVRPYDGNKALYLTSEYHSLYDCLHCWRSTGTYRIRQHFKVHQGGIDERPFQLRE